MLKPLQTFCQYLYRSAELTWKLCLYSKFLLSVSLLTVWLLSFCPADRHTDHCSDEWEYMEDGGGVDWMEYCFMFHFQWIPSKVILKMWILRFRCTHVSQQCKPTEHEHSCPLKLFYWKKPSTHFFLFIFFGEGEVQQCGSLFCFYSFWTTGVTDCNFTDLLHNHLGFIWPMK